MNPGWKTSEFWLSVAAVAIGAAAASGAFPTDSPLEKIAGIIIAVLASMGYTYSRTKVKEGGK